MNKRTSTGVDIKPLSACAGKVNYDNLASSKDTFIKKKRGKLVVVRIKCLTLRADSLFPTKRRRIACLF